MALFDHLFPYTNLHDINLDWIISIIKSIDPAVIQALQQLTPDIIEQVNQKVNEAQAAAIAAQSSASDANAAKENAANSESKASRYSSQAQASAAVASSEASAAIAAKKTIENSLTAVAGTISGTVYGAVREQSLRKTGKTVVMHIAVEIVSLPESGIFDIATFSENMGTLVGTQYSWATITRAGAWNSIKSIGTTENRKMQIGTPEGLQVGDYIWLDAVYVTN